MEGKRARIHKKKAFGEQKQKDDRFFAASNSKAKQIDGEKNDKEGNSDKGIKFCVDRTIVKNPSCEF